jgi:translation elongation factor EF-1alpha
MLVKQVGSRAAAGERLAMNYIPVAEVTHFFKKIGVAVLVLSDELAVGDLIHIVGHTTDFCQTVKSLQIDHHPISSAHPGDNVALRVTDRVRAGDQVFRVEGQDALEFFSERGDVSEPFL